MLLLFYISQANLIIFIYLILLNIVLYLNALYIHFNFGNCNVNYVGDLFSEIFKYSLSVFI